MKKLIWIVPALVLGLAGCNSGDTPVETVKTDPAVEKTDDMSKNINANPNIPDAAKEAMGTK